MRPTLIVMAAGLGSRYGGFKQADGVGPTGEMLFDYAVFDAKRAGFGRIVFIIREELREAFEAIVRRLSTHIDTTAVFQRNDDVPAWAAGGERTKPWGTVHAVLAARAVIDTPFAVLNADDFYGADAFRRAREVCDVAARDGSYAAIAFPLERTLSPYGSVVRGICQTDGEWVTRLDEVRGIQRINGRIGTAAGGELTGHEPASMNFWVFMPRVFGELDDRFTAFLRRTAGDPKAELTLPEAVNELIASGAARVRLLDAPGPWFGLTHAKDRADVTAELQELTRRGDYPSPLWG